jgi:hypothetical protein
MEEETILEMIRVLRRSMPLNARVLRLCDYAEAQWVEVEMAAEPKVIEAKPKPETVVTMVEVCAKCQKKRELKTEQMRRYRANKKGK